MTSGLNIALPIINVLLGNVWQMNPSCAWVHPIASGWSDSQPLNESVTPTSCVRSNCQLLFFFSEHPGENCFQVWVEVNLSGARTPLKPRWLTKLLKYDYREDFVSTMLLCWDVTGFLPRSGRYGSACIHEISSFPFPSLPVQLLFWERSIEGKKKNKPRNQNQTMFWNKS